MLFMMSSAVFFHNLLRVNLGIAIVCMVKRPRFDISPAVIHNASNTSILQPIVSHLSTSQRESTTASASHDVSELITYQSNDVTAQNCSNEAGEFFWDKQLQGIILGGAYWGYILLQIPGGWLCERYGTKLIIGVAMTPVILGTLASPLAARASPYFLLTVRIILGAASSVVFPSIPIFWAKWSPPDEWMRMLGITLAGGEVGSAVSFPIGGVLCKYGPDGGWPSIFYVTGAAGLLWLIAWILLVRDTPKNVPGITEKEKKYLEFVLSSRATSRKSQTTPWLQLLTSRPCVALMFVHFTANFFNYMMLTQIPTYMKEVMDFDISANGFYSMLPYVGLFIMINVASTFSDLLISRKFLSVASARKLMNTIGMTLPGLFMLALAQLDSSQQALGVALLCGAVASFGFCFSGHITNFSDIAVVHAGTLAGVSNTMATVPGIIAPYVVALLTKRGTREEWTVVFYSVTAIEFLGAFVFLLFGSGLPQPWAIPGNVNTTTYVDTETTSESSGMLEPGNVDLKPGLYINGTAGKIESPADNNDLVWPKSELKFLMDKDVYSIESNLLDSGRRRCSLECKGSDVECAALNSSLTDSARSDESLTNSPKSNVSFIDSSRSDDVSVIDSSRSSVSRTDRVDSGYNTENSNTNQTVQPEQSKDKWFALDVNNEQLGVVEVGGEYSDVPGSNVSHTLGSPLQNSDFVTSVHDEIDKLVSTLRHPPTVTTSYQNDRDTLTSSPWHPTVVTSCQKEPDTSVITPRHAAVMTSKQQDSDIQFPALRHTGITALHAGNTNAVIKTPNLDNPEFATAQKKSRFPQARNENRTNMTCTEQTHDCKNADDVNTKLPLQKCSVFVDNQLTYPSLTTEIETCV